jgi:hypothetical protein
MTAEEILNTVRPRMPYWWRVHLRDGKSFDVRYPGLMLVTTKTVVLGVRDATDEDEWPIAEKSYGYAPEQIARLEPLGPTQPVGN